MRCGAARPYFEISAEAGDARRSSASHLPTVTFEKDRYGSKRRGPYEPQEANARTSSAEGSSALPARASPTRSPSGTRPATSCSRYGPALWRSSARNVRPGTERVQVLGQLRPDDVSQHA